MIGRGTAAVGLAMAMAAGPAAAVLAQDAPMTMLHLSASSTVQAAPDQLVAELVAQGTSSSAAEAQRHVNTMMSDGMRATEGGAGIEARATGYLVNPSDEKRTGWTAQQTLQLRGGNGPALLDMVSRLQEKGFVVAALDWQLSSGLRRKVHDEATMAALKEVRSRAAAAAAVLGLHVDHLQDVRLDSMGFQPRMPMAVQAMSARAMPPPQATATPEEVAAQVSADVALRP